ncbi:MAG: SMP-30/gluconolactonase/LRE family protein [Myxococcota bacterium]
MSESLEARVDGLTFAEGPRWYDGALWFSDMHDHCVRRLDATGTCSVVLTLDDEPSGLGWLPDGTLLVVSMTARQILRWDGNRLSVHADLSAFGAQPCNDMVTDAAGRSYVGNFGFDLHKGEKPRTTHLTLVTPDGESRVVADELAFPNGAVITPDGNTLIVGESFGARLTAFTIADDGSLTDRRVWASLEGAVPDGIGLDAEGAVWVASPVSHEVLRVHEGGEVSERIPTGDQAIACALGGDDRRTLFVCISPTIDPEACQRDRAARIVSKRVAVPGAGFP